MLPKKPHSSIIMINGLLLINKPVGITSYDCIRHLKRLLPRKTKIGHAGTLDPFAQGLLIIGIGKATKQLGNLEASDKTYVVTAKLGDLTDTLDLTGTLVSNLPVPLLSADDLMKAAQKLMPSYEQVPPVYSSLKHHGKPLYELARSETLSAEELGKITHQKRRICTIYSLEITHVELPFFSFTTRVSKGTYIRSLANDIAHQVNTCATTHALIRTHVGKFSLDNAASLQNLTSEDEIQARLLVPPFDIAT